MPGAFVINVGDMMRIWTNGLFRATPHRVLRPTGDARRISVPFFFEPEYDAWIEPLEHLQVERGERLAGITYGEHLLSKTENNFDFGDSAQPRL